MIYIKKPMDEKYIFNLITHKITLNDRGDIYEPHNLYGILFNGSIFDTK